MNDQRLPNTFETLSVLISSLMSLFSPSHLYEFKLEQLLLSPSSKASKQKNSRTQDLTDVELERFPFHVNWESSDTNVKRKTF